MKRTLIELTDEELLTVAHLATDWAFDYPECSGEVIRKSEYRDGYIIVKFSYDSKVITVVISPDLNIEIDGWEFENQWRVFDLFRKCGVVPENFEIFNNPVLDLNCD